MRAYFSECRLTMARWRSGWSRWRQRRGRRRPRRPRTWSPPVWSTAGGDKRRRVKRHFNIWPNTFFFFYFLSLWKQIKTDKYQLAKKKKNWLQFTSAQGQTSSVRFNTPLATCTQIIHKSQKQELYTWHGLDRCETWLFTFLVNFWTVFLNFLLYF